MSSTMSDAAMCNFGEGTRWSDGAFTARPASAQQKHASALPLRASFEIGGRSMLLRLILSAILVSFTGQASAEVIFPGYEWRQVADGVYVHMREDPFAGPVDGNSTVIVNDEDVFVVDTHINPAAARAVVKKIKSMTDKPVTHIVKHPLA